MAENQFFISNTQADGPVKNQIAKALVERIVRAGQEGTKFRVVVVIPEVPGFAGQGQSLSFTGSNTSSWQLQSRTRRL